MKIAILLAALLVTACGTVSRGPLWQDVEDGVAVVTWASPQFGIFADEQLRVEAILAGSGADKAGVLPDDILLELAPAEGTEAASQEVVPFTDQEAIRQLIREASFFKEEREWLFGPLNYKLIAGPFRIKVLRDDQVAELPIFAQSPSADPSRWGIATPTPTIVPMSYHFF